MSEMSSDQKIETHRPLLPITAVILAAGAATRMGALKQLLPIHGKHMLSHVLEKVLSFPFERVIIVVGHEAKRVMKATHNLDPRLEWLENEDYKLGQSTSLRAGLNGCPKEHHGLMVFLGDQPFISTSTIQYVLNAVHDYQSQSSHVIRPTYQNQPGHPVYIHHSLFQYIQELKGDRGAKSLFEHAEKQIMIPIQDSGAFFDIDTPEVYEELKDRPTKD